MGTAEQCANLCEANRKGWGDYCCLGRFHEGGLLDCHIFAKGSVVDGSVQGKGHTVFDMFSGFHPLNPDADHKVDGSDHTHDDVPVPDGLLIVKTWASKCSGDKPNEDAHFDELAESVMTTTPPPYGPLLCPAGGMEVDHVCSGTG